MNTFFAIVFLYLAGCVAFIFVTNISAIFSNKNSVTTFTARNNRKNLERQLMIRK